MKGYRAALTDQPVLYTPRLILRRPTEGDVPAIVAMAGDREVASRLARIPHPCREADAIHFPKTIVPTALAWMIVERSSRQVVGAVGLTRDGEAAETVELGYSIARDHWGRGIAAEAGSVVLAHGIGLVGRARLRSGFFADNPASGRVLEKLGFGRHGLPERSCLATGVSRPLVEVTLDGVASEA